MLKQGMHEGVVNSTENLDLLVAVVIGTFGQFARMYYFDEFQGQPRDWSHDLERMLQRVSCPDASAQLS